MRTCTIHPLTNRQAAKTGPAEGVAVAKEAEADAPESVDYTTE